ncbi:putative bifunctional diguanylate cyclase/phosphodiesterase [Piscinibacter terrae]|uniref:EAL domain-containing protein n=1 Tax=Piscinibacter terrae TaxID=2496871 RepID=A0A3N7HQP0_9BURK|nr:EAL domain-containing protein [Albitalea terrae]RQP24514.1 EAL domain-containing protein [Albitalea terrae]
MSFLSATPLLSRADRWLRGSIGARVIAMFLGLLLIVQIASYTALQASLTRHAHNVVPEKLMVGGRVLQSLLDRQAQTLIEGARLLASDYGFREAVSSNDSDTIASVLANHGARIGATQAALVTTSFELRAAAGHHDTADLAALVSRLAAGALSQGRASQVALLGGRPHQVVMVPIKAPLTVGWVLMGVPLDMRLASDMQSLSALNVTLLSQPANSDNWVPSLSSLPAAEAGWLARQSWGQLRRDGQATANITVHGEELGVHPMWLNTPDTASVGGSVLAVISLSVDEAVKLPRDLQLALLLVTLVGFAAFSVFGVLTAGRLTTPLRRLSSAADRLGAGDYSTPVTTGVRRNDEIGHLAQAFEQMRVSVADKQAQILKLAYWDSLTGLPNRVQFRDAVHEAIREAEQLGSGTVSVIMLDLDRFKHVNDVLGYRFGDLLLMRVAERLSQQSVRGADLVARLGGDEFAVLLRNGDLALAQSVAQRIERAFDVALSLEEHTVDMGAGIGLACWPTHAGDADVLLSRAEVAMYSAKRQTSGPLVYDPSIDLSSAQTLSLMSELRLAVGEGQLRLFLQPKLALDSGKVMGAETLVRWQHPVRGMVPPMQFIPFAEQTGFIRTITMWVFEEAARHWRRLHSEGLRITLSVNLSTRDLLDPELPQKFDSLLVKHSVPAEAFCLEITESAIMDDPQRAQATLDRLSALGFKLSIDDFGTGYSSLAYLKRLPVDELKIDKSFVLSMEKDADDAKIVRSTIDLAHNLGLSVVAEGVENAKVWDMLRDLNCDQAQGFHMGRPMAASEFTDWSVSWTARHRGSDGESRTMLH